MTRLNLVLLVALVLSAMLTVQVQYESRRLYAEIEKAAAEARRLETEHERLQVERRAQATPLRVERLAKDQLHMRPASPAITQYVTLPPASAQDSVAAAAAAGGAAHPASDAVRPVASARTP
ncbi:MAG TPA: cell division protein FtsL [Ramlibacter sp.]|jgi:cell division protein FtsL|uniref:cell division protein FtsL n=1 Tax=Ramlibacter sp. TaxID=1917967 RepID=UPI002D32C603|nr:cell division protein FtsL [Ramlibacter sp.]HZY17677.1 cell division protein FtsL [Ramlibacter sp.]